MPVKEEDLVALTRKMIEDHDEWDALHALLVIGPDSDDGTCVRAYFAIDPAIDPGEYPALIKAAARESAAKGAPPYALLLQIEAFGAALPPDASPEDKAQFEADRANRAIYQRADAVEAVWAWTVDVHGRMWSASNNRGQDRIEEHAYEPGDRVASGRMIAAMLNALRLYGSEGS